jgi:hypothetical protein|tara:strand:+ start:5077 stop:5286 length:210 start_codon:yes stop_codon:yes gene_type:complete
MIDYITQELTLEEYRELGFFLRAHDYEKIGVMVEHKDDTFKVSIHKDSNFRWATFYDYLNDGVRGVLYE